MHPSASRYWHTLRYLKRTQIANRLWRTVYRPHPTVESSFALRARLFDWVEPAHVDSFMRGPDEFEFLSVRRRVRDRRDWNQAAWPMLWRYHLHYFDDLNAFDFHERADWHHALIERWIADNPPTVGVGWDPYPTSLRIVNWIKWWLGGALASGNALQSVRIQLARVASRLEYHLLGNHLLENGRALVFGGLFFEGDEANRWLHRGLDILAQQLPEQILDDGGHFERSPMYHQITLAGLLDLYNMMRVFDRQERSDLVPYLQRMLHWSTLMRHPDGDIALFNDAAFHEAPTPQRLEKYATDIGIELPTPEVPAAEALSVHLKPSGYVRVERDSYVALLNVGSVAPDYQPGHAHADTLSFELSAMGRRLIVDTGTSTYERGSRRNWERGSAAHNSIVLNGLNSSDVWGGFRVARRASILTATVRSDEASTTVVAAHDGYRHLPSRAVHERRWIFSADHMRIDDFIEGRGEVSLDLTLNFHPDIELIQTSSIRFVARSFDGTAAAIIDTPRELTARIAEFSFAPRFGTVRAGVRIVASAQVELPQTLVTAVRFLSAFGQLDCP
jgi:uncharacterized heparinase superfamily protein